MNNISQWHQCPLLCTCSSLILLQSCKNPGRSHPCRATQYRWCLGPVPSTTAEFASSPSTSAETAGVVVRGKFRLPEVDVDSNWQPAIDARAKQSQISGPQLAFHPNQPKL